MRYQVMRFGKKNKISLIHLSKPLQNGFVGMVCSPLFADRIAMVVDPLEKGRTEYDFACLAFSENGASPRIMMTKEVYYDIKRGAPYARMILLHELGHYARQDHLMQTADRDEKRALLVTKGLVSEAELAADFFAVEYLGTETVAMGLQQLQEQLLREYGDRVGEEAELARKELELRRMAVLKKNGAK